MGGIRRIWNPLMRRKITEVGNAVTPGAVSTNTIKKRSDMQFGNRDEKINNTTKSVPFFLRQDDRIFELTDEKKLGQQGNQLMLKPISYTSRMRSVAPTRKLFTPGPLGVSERVKEAMLIDLGKRHADFAYIVKFVRNSLVQIANVTDEEYTAIPMNGSGTFATESSLRTMFGKSNRKLLVMENGMYGRRIAQICRTSGINVKVIPMNLKKLNDAMHAEKDISGVIAMHCETSTGMINPVEEIGMIVKKASPGCMYFVDAMTTFGSLQVDMTNVDFLMSNSCKSLQAVPGISFVIANKDMLQRHRCKGNGLVLDIGSQFDELERSGQFRFTPPTHVMVGFKEALIELSDEGGIKERAARYRENTRVLKEGMSEMGFKQLFTDMENPNGIILTSYAYPKNPLFIFKEFHARLSDMGFLISSERTSLPNTFRIGTIGHVKADDMRDLAISVRDVCEDMRIELPLQTPKF